MNDDRRFERDVASVFAGMAPSHGPADLLDDVFSTTGRMRPRPRWLALVKEPPMRTSSRVSVGSPTFRLITIAALTIALLLASLAAVAIGARVLSAEPLPQPFGTARNGPLLYSAGADIYLADADGSNPRAIVTGNTFDQVPWFSQDGTKIAFGRGSEVARALMVADADGSNVTRLLRAGDWWAEFLPGTDQMVVSRPVDGAWQLSIVDIATGETDREFDLGSLSADWWVMPRPPDGQELIFRGVAAGEPAVAGLYGIGRDGTGLRSIGETALIGDDRAPLLDPSLSPDGSTLLYWSWGPEGEAATEYRAWIHLRDLETGEELPVPFDRTGERPQYSPDGTMILYRAPSDDGATHQLFVVPADGSQPRSPVGPTFAPENGQSFGYSPDGTQVFLDQTGATTLIDIATGETIELEGDGPEAAGWQRLAP